MLPYNTVALSLKIPKK